MQRLVGNCGHSYKESMKTIKYLLPTLMLLTLFSCKKDSQQTIQIPNGDFELWDNSPTLYNWQTNSCPSCVPPFETYIVQKVTDVAHAKYAAKFIFNGVYSSWANNKFPISLHPTAMTGYIKSNITGGDTAIIHIDIFEGNNIVDTGNFYETSSTLLYKKIEIPISQNTFNVDSALIKIAGGKKQNTELYVDDLVFIKRN